MRNEDMQQVSFEELLSELSGSTQFGQDELVEMLAYQDDHDKDFCIYHRNKAFCVPLHKIREYFTRHTKPIPPMTKDQELLYLREKVKELQDKAEAFQEADKIARPAPDETEALVEEPEEDTEVAEEAGPYEDGQDAPVAEEEVVPPKKDERIPPPHDRKKQSLKEVRAKLAKDLKDAKLPKKKVTDSAEPSDVKDREEKVDNLLKKK